MQHGQRDQTVVGEQLDCVHVQYDLEYELVIAQQFLILRLVLVDLVVATVDLLTPGSINVKIVARMRVAYDQSVV